MRYIRPKSLTWWAGIMMIAIGAAQAAGWPPEGGDSAQGVVGVVAALTAALAQVLGGLGGEQSPAALIGLGLTAIGLRDAMAREEEQAEQRAKIVFESSQRSVAASEKSVAYSEQAIASAEALRIGLFEYDDEGDDDVYDPNKDLPEGESPFPEGVRDPWADGGSRS